MTNLIRLSMAVAIALSFALSSRTVVRADSPAASPHQTNACNKCPQCRTTCCQLKVEQVDKEKHCWNVECETVCIPNVVFPWQKNCCDPSANNGARVKTVRVLKKHTYTCPACEYSWTPIDRGCCGVGCCHAGCVACDGMPIEMGISVQESFVAPLPPPASPDLPTTLELAPSEGGLMKTEPTALAAGLDPNNQQVRPEASAHGSQDPRFPSAQAEGASREGIAPGFIEHHTVKVASFISRLLNK